MAKLTQDEIDHLSQLARIGLTEPEKAKYSREISEILEYVSNVQKYIRANSKFQSASWRTKQIQNSNVLNSKDLREDKVDQSRMLAIKELTQNAPEMERGYFRVPGVFE